MMTDSLLLVACSPQLTRLVLFTTLQVRHGQLFGDHAPYVCDCQ